MKNLLLTACMLLFGSVLISQSCNNLYVDITADGQYMYFSSDRTDGIYHLYKSNIDGTGLQQLTNNTLPDFFPSLSPDGSKIVFQRGNYNSTAEIYIMDSDGSNVMQLTSNSSYDGIPDFSPDGSTIVFDAFDGSAYPEIFTMNTDGTGRMQITNIGGAYHNSGAKYLPDGSKIYYTFGINANSNIRSMNPDGTGIVDITPANAFGYLDNGFDFNSDGSKMSFSTSEWLGHNNGYDIVVADVDGSNWNKLTNVLSKENFFYTSFHPNDTEVFFSYNPMSGSSWQINKMMVDGTNQTQITDCMIPSPCHNQFVDISSDGQFMYFTSDRVDGTYHLFKSNIDGTGLQQLTNNTLPDNYPAVSPDGSKLVFQRGDYGSTAEIYIMDTDGSNILQLTSNGTYDGSPEFSLDGSMIVFTAWDASPYPEIFRMNIDGTGRIQLTNSGGAYWNSQPKYHPEGTKIYYMYGYNANDNIRAMNLDGTGIHDITGPNQVLNQYDFGFDFNSDGSKMSFSTTEWLGYGNGSDIVIADSDGTNWNRLTTASAGEYFVYTAFHPNDTEIYFIYAPNASSSAHINKINTDGSGQVQITSCDLPTLNHPPVAICQPIFVNADHNCEGSAVASDFDIGSFDPDGDVISFSVAPPGPYSLGETIITFTTNDGEYSDDCSALITVQDKIAPVPDLVQLENVTGECAVTSLTAPTATDNCAGQIIGTHDATLPITGEGTTTIVTWTYDDGDGNTSTQDQMVVVDDVTAPTMLCQAFTVNLNSNGEASVTTADIDGGSYDNCVSTVDLSISGNVDYSYSDVDETFVVTLNGDDGNGNSESCTADVTVSDDLFQDGDCDGVADIYDICPGGDDSVDYLGDGIPDCSQELPYNDYDPDWHCSKNKILVVHNMNNNPNDICINKNALSAHIGHGDLVGPYLPPCGDQSSPIPDYRSNNIFTDKIFDFELFPNPAGQMVTFNLNSPETSVNISILGPLGEVIWMKNYEQGARTVRINFNDKNIFNGVYFVRAITSDGQLFTRRLIINK